jgi:hypothetical protein
MRNEEQKMIIIIIFHDISNLRFLIWKIPENIMIEVSTNIENEKEIKYTINIILTYIL